MKRPPPNPSDDDPTSEESALEYDGTRTDQLDNSYRMRVATASENRSGRVHFDDRGQPRWKWITEIDGEAPPSDATFNHLTALDNDALAVDGQPPNEPSEPGSRPGYDPYDTSSGVTVPRPKRGQR